MEKHSSTAPPPHPAPIRHLYVHVPFCARKCDYCAFYSEALSGGLPDRYVAALSLELEQHAADLAPDTIFFGGGTPSLLTLRQWETIIGTLDRLGLLTAQEWTVECNPATVSFDKARLLREAGVNRVSMGVQSLDETLLDRLGRVHTRAMVFQSFDALRRAGFENLNLDLMFAIPGQTLEVWRRTLAEVLTFQTEHLSSYEVIYEEDTPLFHQLEAGAAHADEDLASDMFEALVEMASSAGYAQYEVANFARSNGGADDETPTYACRHNVNYWRGGSFYGLGPSATSYVRGLRSRNWANTQRYCELLERAEPPTETTETLSPLARAGETAAFGLRMNAGWPFDRFKAVTGYDLRETFGEDMDRLQREGFGEVLKDRFRLTNRGLRFADYAAELFLRSDSDGTVLAPPDDPHPNRVADPPLTASLPHP